MECSVLCTTADAGPVTFCPTRTAYLTTAPERRPRGLTAAWLPCPRPFRTTPGSQGRQPRAFPAPDRPGTASQLGPLEAVQGDLNLRGTYPGALSERGCK